MHRAHRFGFLGALVGLAAAVGAYYANAIDRRLMDLFKV